MKKLLLVLGMVTCMLGLTACGSTAEEVDNFGVTEEDAVYYADNMVNQVNQIVVAGQKDLYASEAVIAAGLENFETALADIGDYQGIDTHEVIYNKDGIIINVGILGTERNATVEIILDKELMLTSFTTNVIYSFGEMMEKAALNTLLGMGTVFAVLILIIFVISSFKLLSKGEGSGQKTGTVAKTADKAIAQIIEQEEADDTELIAVIAAAIAASEGAASTDGYVVRSIKRRR